MHVHMSVISNNNRDDTVLVGTNITVRVRTESYGLTPEWTHHHQISNLSLESGLGIMISFLNFFLSSVKTTKFSKISVENWTKKVNLYMKWTKIQSNNYSGCHQKDRNFMKFVKFGSNFWTHSQSHFSLSYVKLLITGHLWKKKCCNEALNLLIP
jgi:hypothetical protein